MNMLIISDDPYIKRAIKKAICDFDASCTIFEVFTPRDALSVLQSKRIDVVFSEIEMREMNGLSFIEAHKRLCYGICWFVMSEFKNFYDVQKAIKLGVRDYVLKPVDEAGIYSLIENANAMPPGYAGCASCC
ncbi:response regulator [Saccharibacillus sp. CPCC 101409]|uniref:response regulator n=1 Tax=Saccharibacillus sp. CPCC 101409 TaxID=3058041 RepID=UPI002671CA42|nr:response regulator [Saccharibacillus sp. CPCC 101409]MDO3411741.1 response regulator [Saccharibacillus sp. CPCC 101409]